MPQHPPVLLDGLAVRVELSGPLRRLGRPCHDGAGVPGLLGVVGEARGIGLVAGLELVKDKATRENFAPADGVAQHVAQCALVHGVITRGLGDVVNLCPPLIITESEIDELLARIGRALDDTHAWAAQNRLVPA